MDELTFVAGQGAVGPTEDPLVIDYEHIQPARTMISGRI